MFLTYPKISFLLGSDRVSVDGDMVFLFNGTRYVVPCGFECDGASIPRFLWPILGHPFAHKIRRAAVLHDWLRRSNVVTVSESDTIFRIALAEKNGLVKRWVFYIGVRIGAFFGIGVY